MYKIKLTPIYEQEPLSGIEYEFADMREYTRYRLLTDQQIQWLFDNTASRFVLDSKYLFFESESDFIAYKLKWL